MNKSSSLEVHNISTEFETAGDGATPSGNDKNKASKNSCLSDFFLGLDDYSPTLPVEVTQYYIKKGGVTIQDPRVVKLISLAADKFMADVIFDARQYQLRRSQRKDLKRKAVDNNTLEFQDLASSLQTRAVSIRRPRGKLPSELES